MGMRWMASERVAGCANAAVRPRAYLAAGGVRPAAGAGGVAPAGGGSENRRICLGMGGAMRLFASCRTRPAV